MRVAGNRIISALIIFAMVFSYSGFAIPSCDCCNGDQVKKEEAAAECCHDEMTENQNQSNCHSDSKTAQRQKQCNCEGDCECSYLCKMPDYNNAVTSAIQQFPHKLLNQVLLQPGNPAVEQITSLCIHFKPDKAALNPLSLPLSIPLRI